MNIAKNILSFVLIFTVIAWFFGIINLDQDSYEDMTFQEQSINMGSQFNKAVEKGTSLVKGMADSAMTALNLLSSIITTIGNGLEKIAKAFGIEYVINKITGNYGPGASGGGEGGFQGGGGFGGGGGSSW